MAELLDQDRITEALAALPGWEQQRNQLVRRVPVADDARGNIERAVSQVADAMDHHPKVERGEGELTFRVWTHSAGGITAKDVELAGRIDRAMSGPIQDP